MWGRRMSAVVMADRGPMTAWRAALIALTLLLTIVLIAYRDTAVAMVTIWERSETFAHAFVVPPISLWLIWRQRRVLAALRPQPSLWVLIPIALAALLWLLGELAQVNAATQLALVALIVLTVPAIAGPQVARAILFPLGFLFFAVPIGEFLMPMMMAWTADFTVLALRLTGIPVYREGQQLVIPSGAWSIIEACSGIRYLMASLMIGTLFAYLNYRSLRRRWAFVGVSILVPIVANWVRAYFIVLLGHLSNNRLAVGADHLVYGWVFFGIVVSLMFLIGARWTEPPVSEEALPTLPGGPSNENRNLWLIVVGMAAALMWLPHIAAQALSNSEPTGHLSLTALSAPRGGWQPSAEPATNWRPTLPGAAAETSMTYVSDHGRRIGVYVGYFRHQGLERKLVGSEDMINWSSDRKWVRTGGGSRAIDIGGVPTRFTTTQLRGLSPRNVPIEDRLVVWHVYWIGGRLTESDVWAKVWTALNLLRGRGDDAATITIYASDPTYDGTMDVAIEDFLRVNFSALETKLRHAHDGV
jgi:exosortase A